MNIDKINKAYFLGIGGIGMSALAVHLLNKGIQISGYDRSHGKITSNLMEMGIPIHFEEDEGLIEKSADLVVYTPAIPADNSELTYFKDNGYLIMKRAEVLEEVSKDKFVIAVAGSHGKTTVSAMITHILRSAGCDCTAFLGGIASNYNTNYIKGDDNTMIIEADEYDRSFLKLNPSIGIITALDRDHLDIYKTEAALQDAFIHFTNNIVSKGKLIANSELPIFNKTDPQKSISYSLHNPQADYSVKNLAIKGGAYHFDVDSYHETIPGFVLNTGGKFNVENLLPAIAVSKSLGVANDKIIKAVSSFKGVKRRFEYVINQTDLVFIDDYAHHPKEIEALLSAVRELHPNKKITIVFQPHLFSRTKLLAPEFAASLSLADNIILLDIYPARELPVKGINSQLILSMIQKTNKIYCSSSEKLFGLLSEKKPEVLLMAGAGDIDQLVEPVKMILKRLSKEI